MIVRDAGDRLLLITQPDHARLARRVMQHWPALAGHPRRAPVLLAVGEHDRGWAEADEAPAVDPLTGEVVDFVRAPLQVRQAWAPRSVASLAHSPWAAALVAQHGTYVHERFRGAPEWAGYFADLDTSREALLAACGSTLDTLLDDYEWVRLGDLISLAFCTGWSAREQFGGHTVQRVGDQVRVSPVEGGLSIAETVRARSLPRQRFESDADLREALASAPCVTLQVEVVGLPSSGAAAAPHA